MSKKVKTGNERVRIVPLGGLEQIGMNITAFETEESIIVVDCGLAFPEDDMLGVDLVIPDITYLQDNRDKVKGFVITHGHEDHIGALPYVLKELNVPIYATNLTMAIIENKLKEHNLMGVTRRKVVSYGQYINLGDFRIKIRTAYQFRLFPRGVHPYEPQYCGFCCSCHLHTGWCDRTHRGLQGGLYAGLWRQH